ncbi:MAG: hypothetical protein GF421_05720 [Candidatus Aminicenantes bacterium]|nr:hypothetical protein [Candidatus Aminicenantes bacterium]
MKHNIQEKIKNHFKAFSKRAGSSFSPDFADRVIHRIREQEKHERTLLDFYDSLKFVFRKVAVIGAIMLLALISYNLIIGDSFSEEEMIYASETVYSELEHLPLF